jgi:hypothetical protein
MLLVQIQNIDNTFFCVFDGDDPDAAAKVALAQLIEHHNFFDDNVLIVIADFPPSFTPDDDVVGILVLSNETSEEDLEYAIDSESTYWITTKPYELNTVFTSH